RRKLPFADRHHLIPRHPSVIKPSANSHLFAVEASDTRSKSPAAPPRPISRSVIMTNIRLLTAASTITLLALANPAAAQTKFEFWYGLSGDLSERVQDMCKGFNESQADYEIVCVSQENYDNTLQNTIAAYRANKQPTVTQIF